MSSEEKHLPAEEADEDEQPIYLDVENSPLIQNGDLKLNEDGSIDPTCSAVSTGQVQINTMQAIDLTSSAVALGYVCFQVPEPEQVTLVPRRAMRDSEIEAAWNKADTIPGLNADYYRRDRMGNIIYYNSYGRYTPYGWEVDHSKPLNKGGTYHPNNLHPLQAKQNRSKNAEYPYRYQEQEPLGVQEVQPNHSQVDLRCALVRSGALSFKPDGSVDERCSAVRNGDVRLRENEDGQRVIDRRSAAARNQQLLLKPSTQPSSSSSSSNADSTDALIRNFNRLSTSSTSPGPAPPSAEAAVDHRSAVVRGDALLFTQSGAVDRRSSAVKSKEVLLTQSGDIDKRSAAVRNESLLLRSSSPSSSSSSSSSPAPSRGPSTSSSISTPTKADGTPDMRYAVNRDTYSTPPSSYSSSYSSGPTKSDGTPDMRYSSNRSSGGGGGSSSRSSGGGGGGSRSSGGGGGGRSGGGRR